MEMSSLLELGMVALGAGLVQAVVTGFFTWFVNKTLINKLDKISEKIGRDGNGGKAGKISQ